MSAELGTSETGDGLVRIGELARRLEVSPELLRAWERRYGLMQPQRSEGGFRLYSSADEARVRSMQAHMEQGLSAAEAARVALAKTAPEPSPAYSVVDLADERRVLAERLSVYDESAAQAGIDRLLATYSLDTVLADVVLPLLRDVGNGWELGEVSVGQEHFASHVIRGRLMSLARGWDQGAGPRAVLACPAGERHDLGLVCHGLALRARGWRISYLGADTPVSTITEMVDALSPDAVVLVAEMASRMEPHADEIAVLAGKTTLVIGGRGTDQALADRLGVAYLCGNPVAAADVLTAQIAA